MPTDAVPSQAFEQLMMVPPVAVEIVLRIGLMPADEHGQIQLEVRNATDGALLAMSSRPHFDLAEATAVLEQWLPPLAAAVWEHSSPF